MQVDNTNAYETAMMKMMMIQTPKANTKKVVTIN